MMGLTVAAAGISGAVPALASTYTVVYTAKGGTDGVGASGPLLLGANGVLYGVSASGGVIKNTYPCLDGCGEVFELAPKTKLVKNVPVTTYTKTVLYKFPGTAGLTPGGQIVLGTDGSIYGSLLNDYSSKSKEFVAGGYIYKLTPSANGKGAWKESTVHHFAFVAEGGAPIGVTADSQGVLYGVLQAANSEPDGTQVYGKVYSLTPSGATWTEATLHSFDQPYDYTPNSELTMDANGALYGSSQYAGVDGVGQIFQITTAPTVSYSVIHEFTGSPNQLGDAGGGVPYSSVVADANGVLYGTTFGGGTGAGPDGTPAGTVYSLTPAAAPATGWSFSVLHSFDYYTGGAYPRGGVVLDPAGALYGATSDGNGGYEGVFFKMTPPATPDGAWSETDLWNDIGTDPVFFRVTSDGNGAFYGSANDSIFKFVP